MHVELWACMMLDVLDLCWPCHVWTISRCGLLKELFYADYEWVKGHHILMYMCVYIMKSKITYSTHNYH